MLGVNSDTLLFVTTLWVIAPCFFDVPSFTELKKSAIQALEKSGLRTQFSSIKFVLIDDSGGRDDEVGKFKNDESVVIVRNIYNLGHQGALVAGLRSLVNTIDPKDYIVTMDSDGEDKPEDLPQILNRLVKAENNLQKIALAHRTKRKETLLFRLFYTGFKLFFRILTGQVIKNGNYVAFRGWFLKKAIHHPHFDLCYSSSFISLPLELDRVPLARGVRYFGKSKMGWMGLIMHGFRMLLPFGEKIGLRGIIASSIALILCSGGLLVSHTHERMKALILFSAALNVSFIYLCAMILTFMLSAQHKARALRDLGHSEK